MLLMPLALSACGATEDKSSSTSSQGGSPASSTSPSSSSSGAGGAGASAPVGGCSPCTTPEKLEAPANEDLEEASGLVASRRNPGVLYAHNDSGDTARFFGLDDTGKDLGTYALTGVTAMDWEAASAGPCADAAKDCLYFADTGDNEFVRTSYSIHRVEEPAFANAGLHTVAAETFRFTYPNGPEDAEAMFVDPRDGKLYVLSKNAAGPSTIYELPQPFDPKGTAQMIDHGTFLVNDLIPAVTGADMSEDGTGILVRTYLSVWYFAVAPGETVASALSKQACGYPTPSEVQGETIAWTLDGKGYRSMAEGKNEKLTKVSCVQP